MHDTVIYGAGGLGRQLRDILIHQGCWRPIAFMDGNEALHGRSIDGLPVLGDLPTAVALLERGVRRAIVAIGCSSARRLIAHELQTRGFELVSAIHPTSAMARSVELGKHLIIGARVTVCVHARIGPHSILSTGAIIEHDNVIGAGVFIEPAARLAGGVIVEDGARIGIGACVIPGRRIGADATVAPGSVVIRDVPAGHTVRGVPAQSPNADRGESRFQPTQVAWPSPTEGQAEGRPASADVARPQAGREVS